MELTDEQWDAIRKYIPDTEKKRTTKKGGGPWRDPRDVLNGVLWVLRTGAPWADMPARYSPYQTCHRRFQRWVEAGVLPKILAGLRRDLEKRGGIDDVEGFIDGTYVPAKEGGPASSAAVPARQQRSWQLQTTMVFRSLSILSQETDSTVCSPTLLSMLLSWTSCRLD